MENKYSEKDKIILDINNIELFLTKSGYLNQNVWTKINSEWFDWNKANEILLAFEFNEKISATEASVKYGDKIQWINKIFKNDITLEELHSQYAHYTSTNISFLKLLNNFIMLEIILKTFYNIINKNNEQDINNIFNQHIIINDIDINSSFHDKNILGLNKKLEQIYVKINKNPAYKGKDVNYKLIAILYLLSMGSTFSIDINIPQITNIMNLFTLYNKIFINDINISLILFLNVIVCINLCIYANKKKSHFKFLSFDNTNYINFYHQELKKKGGLEIKSNNTEANDDKKNYISLFIFDNDIIKYSGDYFFELLMFQNCLKIFSIYHLSKNQIKLTVNLNIDTMIETLKTFNDNLIINNINNEQKIININTDKILNNKDSVNTSIEVNNLLLLSKNNINKCFSTFNFNELILKTTNFQNENQIKDINLKYLELIQKTKKLYFQNSISTIEQVEIQNNTVENITDDNSSLNNLSNEFKALDYLLNYYHKNKDAKKYLQFYCFKFIYFKCSIFRESKKEIQIIFDYSSIKERILLKYLKDISNILILIEEYEKIINFLNEFKHYNIIFRVCQTNFRSHHLNFFFTMIIKKLVYYVEENKYNRITIYDSKLNTYQENMFVYIKDNSIKTKPRINILKEMINHSLFNNKLKVLNSYLKELVEDWDIIIIGEDIKYHNLVYSKNVNILFLNIIKEINDNSVQNFMAVSSIGDLKKSVMNLGKSINQMGIVDEQIKKNAKNNEYLNIMMYIINDEDFSEKILKFSEDLKNNNNSTLKSKITLICERYFFEEKIIMNSRIKEGKQIYNCIDNYFLVCDSKKKEDIYKYDLYINNNIIYIVNHLKQEITNDFSKIIYSFISTLSSCIELILYILKNKEIEPTKFYYLLNIKKVYYYLEYKLTNIFIKKLRVFDSLLLFDPKKSIPIFCLLSKKQSEEENTENNENFLDLFLRLFLNLNKVVENNKLNETFFEKIHKNIFYQNYDIFKLMAFSYEAFCTFNEIFIQNNYLDISKNNKFEKCHIMSYETEPEKKNTEYKKILEYQKNDKLIVKKVKIYDYNLTNSFIYKHINELKMSFQKANFFINHHNAQNNILDLNLLKSKISSDIQSLVKMNMLYVYQKLINKKIEKKNIKKIINNIKELYYENNCITFYNGTTSHLENLLKEFNTEKVNIKAVKLNI